MVLYGQRDLVYCYLAALFPASIPKVIVLPSMAAGDPATPVSHCCLEEGGNFAKETPCTYQKLHVLPLLIPYCPKLGHMTRLGCKGALKKGLYSKCPHDQPK